MAPSFMLRTFDQAGYYETRCVLLFAVVGVVVWQWLVRRERAFAVLFASGVFFQALMEWILLALGLRGADYHLSVFGVELRGTAACLFQGLAEGGVFGVMGYWLISLSRPSVTRRASLLAYAMLGGLIVALSIGVGVAARGKPISSARPMFAELPILILVLQTIALLAIVWLKGGRAFHYLGIYYLGTLIYVALNFEPMHLLGARYIGLKVASRTFEAAGPARQFWDMLYSHLFEVAGGKIHYFIFPYVLGMIRPGKD